MRTIRWSIVGVVSAIGLFIILRPVRVQTYVLPAHLNPGWVVVDFNNQTCPPLKEGWLWRRFIVPDNRYFCTSSEPEMGWVYERFLSADSEGHLSAVSKESLIRVRATTMIDGKTCKVVATTFWFGPAGSVAGHVTDIIKQHHPECENI
jgi:hypothetical protein